tara:strand:+ start:4058 stop:4918 length:861 start_codon:yes stop_codon:yes gene_type:complete
LPAIITGAAGFIGSHLKNKLGSKTKCCDPADLSMMCPSTLEEIINNKKLSIEAVFHLGAISSTTESNIIKLTDNNILFSCRLLDACIKNNIPFVYASSASVYGAGKHGFEEDVSLSPLNYYAISKASFDMYVNQKIKDNPLAKIVGLRYFNVYGKNEEHKKDMASPVHKFWKQANDTGIIKVFEGSEEFYRDFIHVDDVVNITYNAQYFTNSGIYNVGTGKSRSFMDVAEIIASICKAEIKQIPFPNHLADKYQKYTQSNNNKIINAGITEKYTTLENGIREVISD